MDGFNPAGALYAFDVDAHGRAPPFRWTFRWFRKPTIRLSGIAGVICIWMWNIPGPLPPAKPMRRSQAP